MNYGNSPSPGPEVLTTIEREKPAENKKLTKIEVKYVVSHQTSKRAPETVGMNSMQSREIKDISPDL